MTQSLRPSPRVCRHKIFPVHQDYGGMTPRVCIHGHPSRLRVRVMVFLTKSFNLRINSLSQPLVVQHILFRSFSSIDHLSVRIVTPQFSVWNKTSAILPNIHHCPEIRGRTPFQGLQGGVSPPYLSPPAHLTTSPFYLFYSFWIYSVSLNLSNSPVRMSVPPVLSLGRWF